MKQLSVFFLAFLPLFAFAGGGGGGGGCGPSNSCPGPSLSINTLYSYDNSGCNSNNECYDCFVNGNCANICSSPPEHNEDCQSGVMGISCFVESNFCGSPENTSWAQFCPTVTGNYTFNVTNVSCSGGGATLQFGLYNAGITCANSANNQMMFCDGSFTANSNWTEALTAGQCYLMVFDGNAEAHCTWDFLITGPPLAIGLSGFTASPVSKGIELNWVTDMAMAGKEFVLVRRYDDLMETEELTVDQALSRKQVKTWQMPASELASGVNAFRYLDATAVQPGTYTYLLYDLDETGSRHYLGEQSVYIRRPEQTLLASVRYGSVSGSYTLHYELSVKTAVELNIRSAAGQSVRRLSLGVKNAGIYEQMLDLGELPPGVYLYELKAAGEIFTGKLLKQ